MSKFVFCQEQIIKQKLINAGYSELKSIVLAGKTTYVFINDGNSSKLNGDLSSKLIYTDKMYL